MRNLVLSGGGNKGIGFVGCLKALEEFNLLDNIKNFCGNSIGSLICLLILIGYTYEELNKILLKFDIIDFLNIDILNFIDNYSIYSNEKLKKILKILVSKKYDTENLTFLKLFNLTQKTLHIISINIEDNKEVVFNYINSPNILIFDAICASCAIPFILSPVKINNKLHIDGFLYNNFPCNIFKNDLENTIGIQTKKRDLTNNINNFQEYISNIFTCILNKLDSDCDINYKPKLYIYLDENIGSFDLLEIQEKKSYIEKSYKICKKNIENYLNK